MMYQTHQASQAGHVGGAPRGRAGGSGPSRLLLVLALFGLAALPGHATAGPGGPAAASWVPTGSMTQPRGFQSATLLPSGQVLIAGAITSAAPWTPPAPTSTTRRRPSSRRRAA